MFYFALNFVSRCLLFLVFSFAFFSAFLYIFRSSPRFVSLSVTFFTFPSFHLFILCLSFSLWFFPLSFLCFPRVIFRLIFSFLLIFICALFFFPSCAFLMLFSFILLPFYLFFAVFLSFFLSFASLMLLLFSSTGVFLSSPPTTFSSLCTNIFFFLDHRWEGRLRCEVRVCFLCVPVRVFPPMNTL